MTPSAPRQPNTMTKTSLTPAGTNIQWRYSATSAHSKSTSLLKNRAITHTKAEANIIAGPDQSIKEFFLPTTAGGGGSELSKSLHPFHKVAGFEAKLTLNYPATAQTGAVTLITAHHRQRQLAAPRRNKRHFLTFLYFPIDLPRHFLFLFL